jgi:hypothetical protein
MSEWHLLALWFLSGGMVGSFAAGRMGHHTRFGLAGGVVLGPLSVCLFLLHKTKGEIEMSSEPRLSSDARGPTHQVEQRIAPMAYATFRFAWIAAILTWPPAAHGQDYAYNSLTTYLGAAALNGGTANISGNLTTRLVMQDITPDPTQVGRMMTDVRFTVSNYNSVDVTVRPRVGFWNADGPGGSPHTFISGFNYDVPTAIPANNIIILGVVPNGVLVPNGKFWAGLYLDDNFGTTGATITQMNMMGQGLFDPPVVGTTTQIYQSAVAGEYVGMSAPSGTISGVSGYSLGWQIETTPVPEPAGLTLLGFLLIGVHFARRRGKRRESGLLVG